MPIDTTKISVVGGLVKSHVAAHTRVVNGKVVWNDSLTKACADYARGRKLVNALPDAAPAAYDDSRRGSVPLSTRPRGTEKKHGRGPAGVREQVEDLLKAHIRAHTRTLASGKVVQVAAHDDKRTRATVDVATGRVKMQAGDGAKGSGGAAEGRTAKQSWEMTAEESQAAWHDDVEQLLKEGKFVPKEDLREFPDLVKKYKTLSPEADYKQNGTRAASFKAWFGDWEHDAPNASKVINADGEPAETYNIPGTGSKVKDAEGKPVVVYHGTAHGGFEAFDKEKQDAFALYGAGFYFTQDAQVAAQYEGKDREYAHLSRPLTLADLKRADELAKTDPVLKRFLLWGADAWPAGEEFQMVNLGDAILGAANSPYVFTTAKTSSGDLLHEVDWSLLKLGEALGLTTVEPHTETKSVFLNIRKPLDLDDVPMYLAVNYAKAEIEHLGYMTQHQKDVKIAKARSEPNQVIAAAMEVRSRVQWVGEWFAAQGFDGITHTGGNVRGDREHRVWIAFEPEQIKAVANQGTFDPQDSNIYKSLMEQINTLVKGVTRGYVQRRGAQTVRVGAYANRHPLHGTEAIEKKFGNEAGRDTWPLPDGGQLLIRFFGRGKSLGSEQAFVFHGAGGGHIATLQTRMELNASRIRGHEGQTLVPLVAKAWVAPEAAGKGVLLTMIRKLVSQFGALDVPVRTDGDLLETLDALGPQYEVTSVNDPQAPATGNLFDAQADKLLRVSWVVASLFD